MLKVSRKLCRLEKGAKKSKGKKKVVIVTFFLTQLYLLEQLWFLILPSFIYFFVPNSLLSQIGRFFYISILKYGCVLINVTA